MPAKRKRAEETSPLAVTETAESETLTYAAAQVLVRQLMAQFNLDPKLVLADSGHSAGLFNPFSEVWFAYHSTGAGVSFSRVTYNQASPLVRLDPNLELKDIKTFDIYRSHIPTDTFKSIVSRHGYYDDTIWPSPCSQDRGSKIEVFLTGEALIL